MHLRKLLLMFALALSLAATALASTVTVDDVIKLHKQGVSVEVIKTFIKSSGQKFELTADDILKLKTAGVPDEIVEFMLKSGAPVTTIQPTSLPQQGGEINPNFTYLARFHSVFNFHVAEKKRFRTVKVLEVGKWEPLKNTGKRAGTLLLTENDVIFYDTEGDERFRLPYSEITRLKIENRYPDKNEASHHKLDTYVLWVSFKRDGKEFVVRVFALPRPDKKDPNYGDVNEIANAIQEHGKAVNPKLAEPIKHE